MHNCTKMVSCLLINLALQILAVQPLQRSLDIVQYRGITGLGSHCMQSRGCMHLRVRATLPLIGRKVFLGLKQVNKTITLPSGLKYRSVSEGSNIVFLSAIPNDAYKRISVTETQSLVQLE